MKTYLSTCNHFAFMVMYITGYAMGLPENLFFTQVALNILLYMQSCIHALPTVDLIPVNPTRDHILHFLCCPC